MNNLFSFFKVGGIYVISNLLIRGIAYLTTPFFTRLMSQDDFGEFSNIASWANILSVVITLSLHASVSQAKYEFPKEINQYLSSITLLGLAFTILFGIIIECNIEFFQKVFLMDRLYIRTLIVFCMFYPASQILLTKYRIFNEVRSVVVLTWTSLLLSSLSSLLFVIFFRNKLFGRVLGTYLLIAIFNFCLMLLILYKGHSFSFKYCKHSLLLAIPLIPHEIGGIILTFSDRIMIKQLCGNIDAALYTLAYTIAIVFSVFVSSLNQAWIPWFYDHISIKKYSDIVLVVRYYIVILSFVSVFMMLIGPELVLLFGGSLYKPAVYVIPPICFSFLLQSFYMLYVNVEFFLKKTYIISIGTIIVSALNLFLNYTFIPIFGYVSAAYTTLFSFLFLFVFHYISASNISDCKEYFNIKLFLLSCLFCFFAMFVSLFLYEHLILRIALLVLLLFTSLFVCFLYRNKIITLFYESKHIQS